MKSQGSTPEVSVVITCFNYARYLGECIDSVLAQTHTDYDIVVIDDGSTDNTADVLKAYSNLPNVRCYHQGNGGQARAKNKGIGLARGRYVAFLDADDKWDVRKLEKQVPLFSNREVGVVYSRSRFIDEMGVDFDYKISSRFLAPRRGRVSDYLFLDNFVPFSSSIVRKACFSRCGAFDESLKMGIDWDLWLRMSMFYEFDYVEEPLLLYRLGHVGQMSKNIEERQRCSDKIMSSFQQRFPGAVSMKTKKRAAYHTACNRGFHSIKIDRPKALLFFLNALKIQPFEKRAYVGMVKLLALLIAGTTSDVGKS